MDKKRIASILQQTKSITIDMETTMTRDIETIYAILKENGLYADVDMDGDTIQLSIEQGDWRHDHLYADHIMRDHGYIKTDEVVTEADGSDCYSSVHYYV